MAELNSSTSLSSYSVSKKKIKVLIVDDSALMCAMIRSALLEDEEFEVLGYAHDPYEAREKIKQLNPDIITLDIQMPKMDGLTFLEKIMTLRPMPVVMLSSLTEKGRQETLYALECGALDYLCKPDGQIALNDWAIELRQKLKAAAVAKVKSHQTFPAYQETQDTKLQKPVDMKLSATGRLIAIGSSTGGLAERPANIWFFITNFFKG